MTKTSQHGPFQSCSPLQARSTFHPPDHATAVIHVNDTNDNRPVFMDYSYSFLIGENAGVGAIVGLVKAGDADKVV